MKKRNNEYAQTVADLKEVDRRMRCIYSCFRLVSEPKLLDAMNYELLSLQSKRAYLQQRVKELYAATKILEK